MPANYVFLETVTVGAAGAASVTFNSIPQSGYTDLCLKVSSRDNRTPSAVDGVYIDFNGVTTNQSNKEVYGDGSTAQSGNGARMTMGVTSTAGATANTFGNFDFYIPNYAGSTYKSASGDAVSENNATLAYASMSANLWSNTAAINAITMTPVNGTLFTQHSTFSLYGIAAVGTTPTIAPKATGGDIIMSDGTYWVHTFLSSGTFTPASALSCDYLVVAGGGGGGNADGATYNGGGGGAGGLRSTVTATGGGGSLESKLSVASSTVYTVTIGAGGASNTPGNDSVFSTITSTGGGRGKGTSTVGDGGSGGGGRNFSTTGGTGTANQGYAGGTALATDSGGGGGTGAVGGNASSGVGGNGGNGVAVSITGASVTYGGGGGGGAPTPGSGGTGGGGTAGNPTGVAGTANLGGGGGGVRDNVGGVPRAGAIGGSGVVIIRYPIA